MSSWYRWTELIVIFVLIPMLTALVLSRYDEFLMPVLFALGAGCFYLLIKDRQFKRFRLWHTQDFRKHALSAMSLFVPLALVMALVTYWLAPDLLFALPNENLELWLITLAIYPIVSVIPQEIIFRTFFFHRYKGILPSKIMRIFVSSSSFALAHLVYGNWVAVILSWFGGGVFGYRYMKSRSTLVVIFEHTLWGSYLFTIGIGFYFLVQPA